jgi:hypothetical protein
VSDLPRCQRGHRCTNREPVDTPDGRQHVGAVTARPICDACAATLATVLRDLADLYVRLAGLPTGRATGAPVTMSRELKVPINLSAEALMRRVELVVTSWEEVVRDVAGDTPPVVDVRPGTAAFTACGYLQQRVTPLLALGPHLVTRWRPGGEISGWEWVEMDGTAAALELFALHHRCRSAVGDTKVWETLPERCWTCRARALARELGTNVIRCEACGATLTLDEHEVLVHRAAHMTGRLA